MSEVYQRESVALPHQVEVEGAGATPRPAAPRRRSRGRGTWWRHAPRRRRTDLVAVPHRLHRVGGAEPRRLARDQRAAARRACRSPTSSALFSDASRPYASWYKNSLLIAGVGALVLGLHRRVRGVRLLPAAVRRPPARGCWPCCCCRCSPRCWRSWRCTSRSSRVGDVLPALGLNSPWGLILAYLGGAMGVNVWLLKGYFDTVPRELDEAAKVDGASHARIFFTHDAAPGHADPRHRVHGVLRGPVQRVPARQHLPARHRHPDARRRPLRHDDRQGEATACSASSRPVRCWPPCPRCCSTSPSRSSSSAA